MMISRLAGLCLLVSCLCSHVSAAALQQETVQQQAVQAGKSEATAAERAESTDGESAGAPSAIDDSVLTAEQWERGRSGDTILQLPAVRAIVDDWLADTARLIEIRYPGGEEGEFWVHELEDWLVALGIPADKLVMTPGSGAGDVIDFHLIRAY
jgi:hypothetical protein